MKNLTATICLTITVFLGTMRTGVGESINYSPAQRHISDICTSKMMSDPQSFIRELESQKPGIREIEYLGELWPKVISTLEKIADGKSRTDFDQLCGCSVAWFTDTKGPEEMAIWDRWATGEISIDKLNSLIPSRYFYADEEEDKNIEFSNCILNIYRDSPPLSSNTELKKYENKCSELGFSKGTEKYGDCVMKLYK
ncbi:MAG: hypothetical protein HOJ20_11295 [Rhodospirillaceae bacterium]|jgi:hypothetical protein|nr:hypothetical protein [Rhodospirillales bacterium]MBT6310416.1 hypothetical protein [Rhodospirillaceae bacterium]